MSFWNFASEQRGAEVKDIKPELPCWYCAGIDPEGDRYDAAIHTGWGCEACDERRHVREALRLAKKFITDDTCRHNYEKAEVLAEIDAALSTG